MTEIEAHRIVSLFREQWDKNSKTPNAHALDVAIQALEKQILKKPKEKDCIGFNTLACPECKMALYSYEPYCDNCGQAIDWSDEK